MLSGTNVQAVLGDQTIIIESGKLARQAHGAVTVRSGDTVVLVTVVSKPLERDIDFMPLTVDYMEKPYSWGSIPGNFFRREIGRPSERETLTSRLIDRPIRPLFPKGFRDEVQIIATVLSAEKDHNPDILALTGASAALNISQVPFLGPIAGIRVGYIDGAFVSNPTSAQREMSRLDLVLAASRDAVVMVEGGAEFLHEEVIAQAIEWGHGRLQPLLVAQEEMREKIGREKKVVVPVEEDLELETLVRDIAGEQFAQALQTADKEARREAKQQARDHLVAELGKRFEDQPDRLLHLPALIKQMEKRTVRSRIVSEGKRIDGRSLTDVRPLEMEVSFLPRTHGSAIFARGETKVLSTCTLGSSSDEQRVETIGGETFQRFMLHYNFPPYCVGEVRMVRLSRRELGHGALAQRALEQVIPASDAFPFTIRVVSEVMESNGSSSMASVCAGSLALMDAGVPVTSPVAGIAMGLIKEGDEYFILTDILGDEDHLGDMDFKIAGNADGVTAVQMDIKISGIPPEVLRRALAQARDARLHILNAMNSVLSSHRPELSRHAPQLEIVYVSPDKIKDVIGPGGKNIKAMTASTGATIDIEDSGKISIFAPNEVSLREAVDMVLFYDQKAEVGKDYIGKVKSVVDFGVFVEILPGLEGLVHVSQLAVERVENPGDVAKAGDEMKVKCIEIDGNRIRLSRKAILIEEAGGTFDMDGAVRPQSKRNGPPRGGRPPRRK